MNINQLSEQLKDVPQNRLIDYAKNPNSVVPQFLALAEIQRRQQLSSQAQPPESTVANDVLSQAEPQPMQMQQQPMQAQQMAQQLPENQPGVSQLPANVAPQGFAGGGIVAFASGGETEDYEDEEDLQAAKEESQIMSMLSSLKSGAKRFVSELPRAYEDTKKSIASGIAGLTGTSGDHKYSGMVSEAAKKLGREDLTPLFLRALRQETGGMKNPESARSSAGAMGIAQFMPATAKQYGINPDIPEEASQGLVKHMSYLYDKYNDPKLALAAYNWGEGNVNKWLKSGANPANMPKETRKYASFAEGGEIKRYSGTDKKSDVEDDSLDTDYMRRSQGLYEGVRGLGSALTNPKNYDLLDLYQRAIGQPFAQGVDRFVNEPLSSQAERFRRYSQNPEAGSTISGPAGSNVAGSVSPERAEVDRLAAVSGVNRAANKEGLFKPAATTAPTTDREMEDFDKARVLFEQEQRAKQAQGQAPGIAPELDPFAAYMTRQDEARKALKASEGEDNALALMQAGLGMMAGTSPYALSNIGQGGMQGIAAYGAAKKQRAAEAAALDKAELGALRARELSDIKKAQLSSLDSDRKEKQAIAQERLANMPTREQRLLTETMTKINTDDRIPMLLKQQKDSGAEVGTPEYERFNRQINAIREAYFKQAGISLPVVEAINVMEPIMAPKKENWLSNLFGGSKKPSGTVDTNNPLLK